MEYPKQANGIRFYKYYFHGIDSPITIEARNKEEARLILKSVVEKLPPKYKQSKVIGETIVIPLKCVSSKVVNGVKYIWVGEDKAHGGWLSEEAYNRALNLRKQNK
jgi:hypothetical protein